jgi:hypothetical protein
VPSTITVRKLLPNGEPSYGNGLNDYIADIDAVAQIILTTIRLFEGEWWEALDQGTPMFQKIIGAPGAGKKPETVSLLLQQRIEGVPYVTGIPNIETTYAVNTRAFSFQCTVTTSFGTLYLSSQPGSAASLSA